MKLIFLGTTGYHPNNRRQTACLMLPELGIVLDAGTGMFRVREHLETDTLDIFLTHAHLDHIVGLTYLFDVVHDRHVGRIRVFGLEEKLRAVDEHLFADAIFPIRPEFDYCPLAGELPLSGEGRLSYFPLEHPGGAVGYRLDWPQASIAYVTDTTAATDAEYIESIKDVDVLVHEAYFPDSHEHMARRTGHSSTSTVARVAAAANVGMLALVHMNPLDDSDDPIGLADAQRIFPATVMAEDGMVLEF